MPDDTPMISLLAFLDEDFDESDVARLREVVSELAGEYDDWYVEAPEFVDETDAAGVRTVGLVHWIHAAHDASGAALDEAIDRRHLEEVRRIIACLERFSRDTGTEIAFELDGGSVGWIENGTPDRLLRVGLVETWAARYS